MSQGVPSSWPLIRDLHCFRVAVAAEEALWLSASLHLSTKVDVLRGTGKAGALHRTLGITPKEMGGNLG